MMRLIRLTIVALALCLVLLVAASNTVRGQTGVEVEAIIRANVRAEPRVEAPVLLEILPGTRYPMIGRSARVPWFLIQLPGQTGWVFRDVVTVYGDILNVPVTEAAPNSAPTLTPAPGEIGPTLTPGQAVPPDNSAPFGTTAPGGATPAAPNAVTGVFAEAIDFANVRFGPGVDQLRIGEIRKGQLYAVLRRHTRFNWIEIANADVAGGRGWVSRDVVTITGDVNSVPATDALDFGYPTLTPTALMVVTSAAPWAGPTSTPPFGASVVNLNSIGNSLYNYLLSLRFVPGTPRQGSAFILDLGSGQSISLNPNVAYSGVSVIKIPLMVAFFRRIALMPTAEQAQKISEMVVCSENLSSNWLLRFIGDGDEYAGAQYVTATIRQLGLKNTFLTNSFFTGAQVIGPTPTLQPFIAQTTGADQVSTQPDGSNQTTPEEMGWLLSGIYTCAKDGSGPLTATFPGEIDQDDCRRMIRVLRANVVTAFTTAGVPADGQNIVAHKHGYAETTHGDAGVIYTPGGDFVVSVMLYDRQRLDFKESFPAISEITRAVYNAFNPSRQMNQINDWEVPLCSIDVISAADPTLLADLQNTNLPPVR